MMKPFSWQHLVATTFLSSAVVLGTSLAATAADVTAERLINAGREPQNWLMQNQSYQGWNWSGLNQINKENVKNLRVAFAVPITSELIGTLSPNNQSRPLVEDGMMFYDDGWGLIYKVDVSSGKAGRIVWTADGAVSKSEKQITRGLTMWGNSIY